jgi:hypothetical protein
MMTEVGRAMALKRAGVMKAFFDALDHEMSE